MTQRDCVISRAYLVPTFFLGTIGVGVAGIGVALGSLGALFTAAPFLALSCFFFTRRVIHTANGELNYVSWPFAIKRIDLRQLASADLGSVRDGPTYLTLIDRTGQRLEIPNPSHKLKVLAVEHLVRDAGMAPDAARRAVGNRRAAQLS
jgi:hypothetical protein